MKKIVLLLSFLCIVSSISLAQFSRSVILPSNVMTLTEQLELERIEAEKKAQEEAEKERKKQEELAKKKAEEERIRAEQEKLEAEKKAEQARLEAERKAEQARLEAKRKAEEKRKKQEAEAEHKRLEAEKARIEAEKRAEKARLEDEQIKDVVAERLKLKNEEEAQKELEKELAKEQARLKRERKKEEMKAKLASIPWCNFIMANAGLSSSPDYAFGLTYARVKQFGFYVSAMSNFGFKFDSDYNGYYDYFGWGFEGGIGPAPIFYTGEIKYTRLEAVVGGVVRMGIPLYAYTGLGYGYRGAFCETANGQWVKYFNYSTVYNGVVFEIGLMGNIKGFAISAGYSMIANDDAYFPEAKIGIGYCF